MVVGFNFPSSLDRDLPIFTISCVVDSKDVLSSMLSLKSFIEEYFPSDVSPMSSFVES